MFFFFMIQIFKKLGDGEFLGPTREPEYGGLELDYSYSVAIAEELGSVLCSGVPMAIDIQSGTKNKMNLTFIFALAGQ